MINIDFLTIKAFVLENIDFLIGARIQKIQQPTRKDFILLLRNNAQSRKLYININPIIYHMTFMNQENEQRRNIVIPKHPPMFCMLLRKYLDGSHISDACAIENERIIELHFETYNDFGQSRHLCLAIELMGKHSNVILYDKETSVIIGCAHNVSCQKSRYRELQGGLKYVYPPKKANFELSDELKKQFSNLTFDKIQSYLATENFRPAILDERYTLFSELLKNSILQKSVSEMLDNYYTKFQESNNLRNNKSKLFEYTNAKLKKNKTSLSKIESLLLKRNDENKYKQYGELLTSNLYLKFDYKKEITLHDYISDTDVVIPLDETKTMNENAQKYFKLYTKYKTTKEKSVEILNKLLIEKEYLENIIYSIDSAQTISDLPDIENELGLSLCKTKTKTNLNITKLKVNEYDVYIGKNNKQNDFIISKLSNNEDYWFHIHNYAGSHVLLKVLNAEPDENTIYKCAQLAKKYSSAKQPSKVGIIYTKRKFIKKPPSAPFGYVIYKNEKEILI